MLNANSRGDKIFQRGPNISKIFQGLQIFRMVAIFGPGTIGNGGFTFCVTGFDYMAHVISNDVCMNL